MKQTLTNTEKLLGDIRSYIAVGVAGRTCIGSQSITLSNSTVSTLTVPEGAVIAELTLESAASPYATTGARYSLSTVTPVTGATVTVAGVPIGDGDTIEIMGGNNLSAFKVINADSTTRSLKVQYFK